MTQDASDTSHNVQHSKEAIAPPPPTVTLMGLEETCVALKRRVDAFLAQDSQDEAEEKLQSRVRESLGVVAEAIGRYRSACAGEVGIILPLRSLQVHTAATKSR
jgi:hypothetical protein